VKRVARVAVVVLVTVAVGAGAASGQPAGDSVPKCNALPATIVGTDGSDTFVGSSSEDVIVGLGGDDVIVGNDGNDTICGGDGDDNISAGDGDDTVYGNAADDTIIGGGGNDTLHANAGDDRLDGRGGSDSLYGDGGNDWLLQSESRHRDRGTPDPLTDCGDGNKDSAVFGLGDGPGVTGCEQILTPYFVTPPPCTIFATRGVPTVGTPGDDVICGTTGSDVIDGAGGNDVLVGDDGEDQLDGGPGDDRLYGDDGHDTLTGGPGDDTFYGGRGRDTASYAERPAPVQAALIFADPDIPRATTANGDPALAENDVIFDDVEGLTGGDGDDELQGGTAGGVLIGGNGDDTLRGGGRQNRIFGGPGNDEILGGGNDLIDPGTGDDSINARGGRDLLVMDPEGDGSDVIDGSEGLDTITWAARTTPTRVTMDGVADDGQATDSADPATSVEHDNITGFEHVIGGSGDDVLTGGNDPFPTDTLAGGAGNDVLDGRGAGDVLLGGDGDDLLLGVELPDRPSAPDLLDCGPGFDRYTALGRDMPVDCEQDVTDS
jgi:Ca2+-binding RTX toxin-like protein